jgi:hypothetical protein
LEEDSVACEIEDGNGDSDSGSRDDDALQRYFECDVQTQLAEFGHLAVSSDMVSGVLDLSDSGSSSDVGARSACIDDSVSSPVISMAGDSRTDGVVVRWTVTSNPTSTLIDTELINSLRVSERGVGDQCTGDQASVLDPLSCVRTSCVDVRVEQGVGAGWQDVIQFQEDSVSGRDYPSGVGCTVADSNTDGERMDALIDVFRVQQICSSGEVRRRANVDPCDVLDCQLVDGLRVASSSYEVSMDIHSVQHWRCDKGVTINRCYSRPGHSSVLVWMSYLTRVLGTWHVRGLTRRIFDPGGIRYNFHFCTSVLSSPMQGSSIDRLCYHLQP